MRRRRVLLFGRLRDAGLGTSVELEVGARATAAAALEALRRRLGPRGGLVQGVVLATETEVLAPSARLPASGDLAALPPVCGG